MSNAKNRNTTHDANPPDNDPLQAPDMDAGSGVKPGTGPDAAQEAEAPERRDDPAAWGKRLEEARAESEKFRDQLLRKAAEFENYKRRTEIDWQNMQRFANEKTLLAFLPILDDFFRSLKSGAEQKNFDAFYQGVELIYHKMQKTFQAQGVEPIEAVGNRFNVDEHDALLQIPRDDVPPQTVLEEVEKGYRLGDRVLRHAKVIVSAETPAPAPGSDKQGRKHDPT